MNRAAFFTPGAPSALRKELISGTPEEKLPPGAPEEKLPGEAETGSSITGNIRLHRNFHSEILGNERDVHVYLPPGYAVGGKKQYPVLYLADGQNVFNRDTSFGGVEWGVDEIVEDLIRKGKMKEVILVAVNNTPDRMNEYTPVPDPAHGGGKLDAYADFLIKELKPFIDSHYCTSPIPENTGIMGSSLGGLSALYLGWTYPHVFSLVGALSPSIWWAGKDIIGRIGNDPAKGGPEKVWLSFGHRESSDENQNGLPDGVEDAREMASVLFEKGYVPGESLFYFEDPDGAHNEGSWNRIVALPMMNLFPPEGK